MVAYIKPQKRKKEAGERLRGDRDQTKFIDLRFTKWQVVGFGLLKRYHFQPVHCEKVCAASFRPKLYPQLYSSDTAWWTASGHTETSAAVGPSLGPSAH